MWHDSVLHRASYMFLKYYILFLSWRQGPLVWEEISSLPRFWFRGALKSFQINPANWKLCQFWRKPIPWVCKVWWKGVYMLNVSICLFWNKNVHFSKVESPFDFINLEGYLIFYHFLQYYQEDCMKNLYSNHPLPLQCEFLQMLKTFCLF